MIIEFEATLLELVETERNWNEICRDINQPMSMIAVALKQLTDAKKITKTVRDGNIFYAKAN